MPTLSALLAELPVEELPFLLGVAFVAGLARGFSGFGSALIFVPLASAAIGPALAAPSLLIVDGLTTLGLIPDAWRRADRREVGLMSAGSLIGVPIGTWLLLWADPVALRWGLAVVVLMLLALLASGWRYHGRAATPLTVGVGIVAGFLGGAIQVSGPPILAYWLGQPLAAVVIRANVVLFFAIGGVISISAYLFGGLLTLTVVLLAAALGPAYALALWLGTRMFGLTSDRNYRRLCYALIAASALLSLPLFD